MKYHEDNISKLSAKQAEWRERATNGRMDGAYQPIRASEDDYDASRENNWRNYFLLDAFIIDAAVLSNVLFFIADAESI